MKNVFTTDEIRKFNSIIIKYKNVVERDIQIYISLDIFYHMLNETTIDLYRRLGVTFAIDYSRDKFDFGYTLKKDLINNSNEFFEYD
jgi:hypothetical protein